MYLHMHLHEGINWAPGLLVSPVYKVEVESLCSKVETKEDVENPI